MVRRCGGPELLVHGDGVVGAWHGEPRREAELVGDARMDEVTAAAAELLVRVGVCRASATGRASAARTRLSARGAVRRDCSQRSPSSSVSPSGTAATVGARRDRTREPWSRAARSERPVPSPRRPAPRESRTALVVAPAHPSPRNGGIPASTGSVSRRTSPGSGSATPVPRKLHPSTASAPASSQNTSASRCASAGNRRSDATQDGSGRGSGGRAPFQPRTGPLPYPHGVDDLLLWLLDTVQSIDPVTRTLVAGLAVMLETSILIGLIVPGDTIVIIASMGVATPLEGIAMGLAVVVGALIGRASGSGSAAGWAPTSAPPGWVDGSASTTGSARRTTSPGAAASPSSSPASSRSCTPSSLSQWG